MYATMEQYFLVFFNHRQDDWVKWLPFAECASNYGTSEFTQCTLSFGMQCIDPAMSGSGEPTNSRDQSSLDADQAPAGM